MPNLVFAGPSMGTTNGTPTFRDLVLADLPPQGSTTTFALFGNGTSAPAYRAVALGDLPTGAQNNALVGNGIGIAPSYQQINLTSGVTGVLGVPNGGIGTSALINNGMLYGDNSPTSVGVTNFGAIGLPFVANGSTIPPGFALLSVPGGGTNTTSLSAFGLAYANGSSSIGVTAVGTAGQVPIGQTATSAPVFHSVAQDLTLSAAGTATVTGLQGRLLLSTAPTTSQVVQWNGSAWTPASVSGAGTVTEIDSGFGLTGGPITGMGAVSISTSHPPYGFDTAINMAMTASVQTGILTISILGNNGSAISSTNPVLIPFKSTTLANGSPVWVAQTGSLSLSTFTTSANFGVTNATPFRLWITALYNGGNPLLALINCSNSATIYPLAQHTLVNGVGIVGTSNSGGVFYTSNGTTASTTAFCILGYAEFTAGIATAGNFSVVPNLQLFGPGVKKPGDVVQFVTTIESTTETTTSLTFVAATAARVSITPTSTLRPYSYKRRVMWKLWRGEWQY